jgi:hypothetical protein
MFPGRFLPWCISILFTTTLAGCLAGCTERPSAAVPAPPTPAGPAWFEEVTEKSGLNFVHDSGAKGKYFMPETVGSGAALFDYDNDGRLDIYLVQNGGPGSSSTNRLFHQGPDGQFTDVSKGSGLDVTGYGMGVAIGDVNNDGWPDVLVTEYRGVRLFLNNGNGTFTEVTKQAGLQDSHWAVSAAFVDYDRDGWLDLVVVNYVDYLESTRCTDHAGQPEYCGPTSFVGTATRLYRNLGRAGTGKTVRFEDVTLKSGLGNAPGPGLGVVCADFDGDGWPDIFVTNDAQANRLWINRHDGTFQDEALKRGLAYNALGQAQANMGIAIGDVKGQGLFSLYVTHLTEENNVFWSQGPRGMFQDQTGAVGLIGAHWHGTGFGAVLADFDHDGFPDLAVANGRVRRPSAGVESPLVEGLGPYWSPYAERNQLFANDGTGRFKDISMDNNAFCGKPAVGRGLAWGDVDGDGAIDLLVTNIAGPAQLYRNIVPNRGHWLLVRALDPALGGRDAYGATITLQLGSQRRVGWVNPGSSYACSNDPRAHFGLGSTQLADALEVLWPDGTREVFPGTEADRVLVLRKGTGKAGR